jgi:hypothetical protein
MFEGAKTFRALYSTAAMIGTWFFLSLTHSPSSLMQLKIVRNLALI